MTTAGKKLGKNCVDLLSALWRYMNELLVQGKTRKTCLILLSALWRYDAKFANRQLKNVLHGVVWE